MTLRIGILGAARITPVALVQPARDLDDVELAVVAARDRSRADAFAAAHDITKVVDTYREVIDADVDAIYNPLPINLHAEWTIAALRAGKHVLCEKPFTMNADEAREVVAVAEETGLVCMEAFHWRFHPVADTIAEVVTSGRLGEIGRIEAVFNAPIPDTTDIRHQLELGGGSLMDLGCYAVQWVRHVAGEPTVTSAAATEGSPGVDLTMVAELGWPAGATGTISCSMAADVSFAAHLTVTGVDGSMRVVNPLAPHLGGYTDVEVEGETTRIPHDPTPTYTYQLRRFVDSADGKEPSLTGGDDSIANMTVIDSIYQAAGFPRRGDPM